MAEPSVVIIGKGPAGISAAIYAVRAGANVTVIGQDGSALLKTDEIENYYGFPEVISGKELLENGVRQAQRLGVNIVDEEVVNLGYESSFVVKTTQQEYAADAVVIATGAARHAPKIKGLNELEGHGVSYCAVCDAFFYKGKDVAVLGSGEYAAHEAEVLLPVANSVTLLTNGGADVQSPPAGVEVRTQEIAELIGEDGKLRSVKFADGSAIEVAGLFIAVGIAGSEALAKKIGAITEGNKITVDGSMMTNVPGLYAAGDCTGGHLQISAAVYEGMVAGIEAAKHARNA